MIGSSELLLTMGALIIFGLYAMQANRSMITTDTWSIENEMRLEAAKIGEAVIHQAVALPFDQNVATQTDRIQRDSNGNPTNLTPIVTCDLDDEDLPKPRPQVRFFEDFDCHKFSEEGIFGDYSVITTLKYVDTSGQVATGLTLRKQITVEVSNRNLDQERPITMRFIKSYH